MKASLGTVVMRCQPGPGEPVQGEALVSRQGFNARYDMDRNNGVFSRPEHDLYGHSFVGKILVFASCKGGIATSWALLDLQARGLGPLALIFGRLNPVVVQGAVLAGLPLLHSVDPDPVDVLRTGDVLRIEPSAGLVILLSRTFE